MSRTLSRILGAMLLLAIAGSGMAVAQDFNPENPPEPQTLNKLTVTAQPAGAAKASGTGRYKQGTRVYVNTSAVDTDYAFVRWEKNGRTVSTSRSFYYTTGDSDETLSAVYEYVVFNPASPGEPSEVYKWRLFLDCDPEEGCSFNLDNGSRHLKGDTFTVTAYPSQGFVFDGWFEGNAKVSDALSISYTMPGSNAALTARFRFVPLSPDEPSGNQPNVDNSVKFDVNGDGHINALDSSIIESHKLKDQNYLKKYDLNLDGVVNVVDANAVTSRFLTE